MDLKQAGSSFDTLISSFNARIAELQELAVARNMYPTTSMADLSQIDTSLTALESQIQSIRDRLQEERNAIPKAKRVIEMSLRQQRKLQHMLAHVPVGMQQVVALPDRTPSRAVLDGQEYDFLHDMSAFKEDLVVLQKEKKVRSSAPRWYLTSQELDSLSSYMKGRLTLDKVNIAINEIATHADANSQLITAPKKKLAEDTWERALELRDIAMSEAVRGKYFILESDIKGPGLKLDNTGKAILTVLCKLCFRSFANGRALGGHMRSHVVASAKAAATAAQPSRLSHSSSSSGYEEHDDDVDPKGTMLPGYGLRNNPKRSFRLVDPEFAPGSSSIIVQDVESETESSRPLSSSITHRPRSKRARRSPQPEPDSSVSDITTEEDVAISLMMMSRGIANNSDHHYYQSEEDEQLLMDTQQPVKGRSKYQCGACKKVFKSYQALGGHRASRKKTNGCVKIQIHEDVETNAEKVQHECPICYRVFSSGQALGGHKRSHLVNSPTMVTDTSNSVVDPPTTTTTSVKYGVIDLNLPAPLEEDAELSAVSDVEFVIERNCNY